MTEASEVQETPDMPDHLGTAEPRAEETNPQGGSQTTATQVIASPAALPIAPTIVYPPTGLTDLIANIPPSNTSGQPQDNPS